MIPAKRGDMYQRSAVPKKNSWRGTFPKSAAKLLRETDLKRQRAETIKKNFILRQQNDYWTPIALIPTTVVSVCGNFSHPI